LQGHRAALLPGVLADASRQGPIVQVGHDLDDGCRGGSGLPSSWQAGTGG